MKYVSSVKVVAIVSISLGLFTFHPAYPNLFPEVPSLWWFNQGVDLKGLIGKYLDLDGMWYRPSQTWTYFQAFELVFDWRNPATFRWLTIGFHTLTAISVVLFSRVLFPTQRFTALFAGVYFATSPNVYFLLVEAASHDYPYIIASIWSLILLLNVLHNPRGNIGWKLIASVLLYVFALTNREIVITLPILVFTIPIIFRQKFRTLLETAKIKTVAFLLTHLFVFLSYYFLHISKLPTVDSGYRTVFHIGIVIDNCVNFCLWLLRVFVNGETPAFELFSSVLGLFFGLFILAITTIVLTNYFYTQSYKHNPNLLFALVATALFCAVPAVAGGFAWHINLAIACFAPVVGYCVEKLGTFSKLEKFSYYPLMLFFLIAIGYVDLQTQMKSLSAQHGVHIVSAINDPPRIDASEHSALIYYEIGEKPKWAFGVGKLFRFLYDDLSITEKAHPSIYYITNDEAKAFLSHSNRYYLIFNPVKNKWEDKTNWAIGSLQRQNH